MVKATIINAAANAIKSLHFIMTDSTGVVIALDCQRMIDLLFDKFPTAMARPSTTHLPRTATVECHGLPTSESEVSMPT